MNEPVGGAPRSITEPMIPDDQNIPLMRERIKKLEEENRRLREAVKKTYREIHMPEPLSENLGLTNGLAFAQSIMRSNFAALAAQEKKHG